MYVSGNPKTKKQINEWIKAGRKVTVYQPALGDPPPRDGFVAIEGPQSPAPHTWYGTAKLENGYVIKVK